MIWRNLACGIAALCLIDAATALPADTSVAQPAVCHATSNWPGWSGIKYAFIL
jgi:hypothetical protein